MKILTWIAYGIFAVSALGIVVGLSDSDFMLTVSFCLLSITGVLFMALDKAITTLVQIKDVLSPASEEIDIVEVSSPKPTRSIEELTCDLDAAKSRLNK